MDSRIRGFGGEFLWEMDIARSLLVALADAAPEEVYQWRPADGARSFSAVLVHIAAANFGLLHISGIRVAGAVDLFGEFQGVDPAHLATMVRKSRWLERTVISKQAVIDLLQRSIEAVQQSFIAAGDAVLETPVQFLGEQTTVRRVYLRILAHSNEHLGQAIAYVRANGLNVPWPDPLEGLPREEVDGLE